MSTQTAVITGVGALGLVVAAFVGGVPAALAIIQAVPILESWFAQIVAAWISSQNQATQSMIIDAAAAGAHAVTQADRQQAAQLWQKALQRPRILP